jgi:uncharacterized protein (TIGR03067 family)
MKTHRIQRTRRSSRPTLSAVTALLLAGAGLLPAADSESKDRKSQFTGIWVADRVISGGQNVPAKKFPFEIHFKDNRMIFKNISSAASKDRIHTIVTDDHKTPATLDITREFKGEKRTAYGIYKFEKDRLFICTLRGPDRQPSKNRPTTFESNRKTRADVMVLKRKLERKKSVTTK